MTVAAAPETTTASAASAPPPTRRGGLFAKYFLSLMGIVTVVLAINGGFDTWFAYENARDTLARIQREKAEAAGQRVSQFVGEIERQIGWTTAPQWAAAPLDQRRFDFIRLLRQVPAITELTQIDGAGREQLKVSRLSMDVVGSGADWSTDARFLQVQDRRVWYSPVYLRKESEPYMSVSLARAGRRAGATVAEVNLKLTWDVVNSIKVGDKGYAYVVDRGGRLIAHPDISLVLRNTDMTRLAHVRATSELARDPQETGPPPVVTGVNLDGARVLSAAAVIPDLGWLVFVELPLSEAYGPLYQALWQTAGLLAVGLVVAALGAWVMARRMIVPIRALSTGAAELGAGDLGHRIDVRTGDEIEELAGTFNRMAGQLEESYADLERKVEERTQELARSVDELTASGEILRLIAGAPDDLQPMFQSILEHATRLCEASFGYIWMADDDAVRVAAMRNVPPALAAHLASGPLRPGPDTVYARAVASRAPVQVADIRAEAAYVAGDPDRRASADLGGIRTLLGIPMIRNETVIGVFGIFRQEVRPFTDRQVGLLGTFADQAVIAIENSRLLGELRSRTDELSEALEYQTATTDVLKVISRSTFDLDPVLQSLLETAVRVGGADMGGVFLPSGGVFRQHVGLHLYPEYEAREKDQQIAPGRGTLVGRVAMDGAMVHVLDALADPEYAPKDDARVGHVRTMLGVPLMRERQVVGVMALARTRVEEFTSTDIERVRSFADQAVIAVENVRLLTEIRDKSLQLEVASRHKSQFLANMSHELRTPLNAVLGYAELIVDGIYGDVPDKAREVLERIQTNGRHLLALINDVLDLSKIEAGQLNLTLEPYAVGSVVATVAAATGSLASAKGLALRTEVADGLPNGRGDERRIAQVLLNLAGNAIKFTDSGEVAIRAAARDGMFEIAVSDTGPGIAPEDQQRIFEEFQQVDNSSTRKKGGTGLGLAISRRIVQMHGGRLTVESVPGQGSTFRVTIPINVESQVGA